MGIDRVCNLDCDNWDNGVYLIKDWKIVGREYFTGEEQDGYELKQMLYDIDEAQPRDQQVGRDFINEQLKLLGE